jgi:hypothetical protein
MEHRPRMRVERYCGGHRSDMPRALDNRLHYLLVPEMQTVKNAKRQDCRPHDIGIIRAVKYLHVLSKGYFTARPQRKGRLTMSHDAKSAKYDHNRQANDL